MDDIIISTTKLSDLVPIIVMAFLLSLAALICCVLWFFIDKQNQKSIEELEGRIEDLEGEIEEQYKRVCSCASDTRLQILEKKILKLQHRYKMPVCADEKKKNE